MVESTVYFVANKVPASSMPNHNTSSNPASSGEHAPAPSPVASRTRGATAERQADPAPGVEADAVAATNPPAAAVFMIAGLLRYEIP